MKNKRLFGLSVTIGTKMSAVLEQISEAIEQKKGIFITFVNPYVYAVAREDSNYVELLDQHDLILSDGIGVKKALDMFSDEENERISFDNTSLASTLFPLAAEKGWKVVLVGGKPGITEKAGEVLKKDVADIQVVGCLDGYTNPEENQKKVMALKPDVVVCGMGVPRQEAFIMGLKELGFKGAALTCGGFFDQTAASGVQYYPVWVDRYNVRWIYRLAKEPRRLARRYLWEYRVFVISVLLAKLGLKKAIT
ncbi:MAG: WecB/TagA/CpsF family glycosyltransferase [Alphaproteobacteria bacterium]|nr:WecB/TagA/CpsF family glycosyltransferase [Alphaproteobacteria bacterium]MDD9920653.1 WecB/TagA/CpsF family glycosyltransferase [Alphaproteobacteria bacterium]